MQLITAPIDVVRAPLSTVVSKTALNCATGQCRKRRGERGYYGVLWALGMFHCEWTSVAVSRSAFITPTCNCDCNWSTAVPFVPHRAMNEKFAENLYARLNCCCCRLQHAVVAALLLLLRLLPVPAAMTMLCLGQRHRLNRYAPRCT